ncbi:hypothetical protein BBJ28_00018450 [Nothophytophthora sp. Chile5]|nr:hypothetical protein BBJ28_00018450 [Nothophytophthora sp. Chile5]
MAAGDPPYVEPSGSGTSSGERDGAVPLLHVTVVGVDKSKVATARNERTPLVVKPEEEVYPLPWFRSPEWTKRPPPGRPGRNSRRQTHRRQGSYAGTSKSSSGFPSCCCGGSADAETESDLELGYLVRGSGSGTDTDEEADSFKQCIQFLVGLIVIMAMALILLIIFQPKPPHSLVQTPLIFETGLHNSVQINDVLPELHQIGELECPAESVNGATTGAVAALILVLRRKRKHGFRTRRVSISGRKLLKRRFLKGRWRMSL